MDDNKDVKVFGKDDEGLKSLGKLLSNETSRKVMECLRDEPMYINQVAKKLGLQMNLVTHHIKLLEDAKLLTITQKKITRKGEKHKHYQVVSNIFINITETKDTMNENGFFKRIFRDGIKFVVVGLTGISLYFIKPNLSVQKGQVIIDTSEKSSELVFYEQTVFFPMLIIVLGLIIISIFNKKKKKKGY